MATQVRALASCLVASACAASSPTVTSVPAASAPSPFALPSAATDPAPPRPLATNAPSSEPTGLPTTGAGPQDDDHDPPEILYGLIRSDGVELQFSEPLAPVGDVEPSSFRLSFATGEIDDGDAYTYHVDIAELVGLEAPLRIVGLELDEAGRALQLSFSETLPPQFCDEVEEERGATSDPDGAEFGLFLHYAPPSHAKVLDRSGNALATQGGRWVTSRAQTMETEFEASAEGSLFGALTEIHCSGKLGASSLAWRVAPSSGLTSPSRSPSQRWPLAARPRSTHPRRTSPGS